MDRLDPIDARLLDEFQRDFPLVDRPFLAIAETLSVSEAEVIARLVRLQSAGTVARVGATVRPNTAGASTLAAMSVPEERVDEVAALVGNEPGVNHSYLRENDWNLWFVATAPDNDSLAASLARISGGSGLRVLDLRLVQPFNIDLGFSLRGGARPMTTDRPAGPVVLDSTDRAILHALAQGLPLVARPFGVLAGRLAVTEQSLQRRILALSAARIITRLGVIVRHRALGFTSNAMVVWKMDDAAVTAAGHALAAVPGVTLCYQRRTEADVWPYGLYAMIHGRSRAETLAVLDRARALPVLAGADHKVLFSTRCFKQTGARIVEAA